MCQLQCFCFHLNRCKEKQFRQIVKYETEIIKTREKKTYVTHILISAECQKLGNMLVFDFLRCNRIVIKIDVGDKLKQMW